jgi:esterase/lipase
MKGMFLCKHARQVVLPGIVFLATRVKDPNQQDYIKLVKLINYLKAMEDEIPKMSTDNSQIIKWYIDSSFAVYKDMRSHTGAVITLAYKILVVQQSILMQIAQVGLVESVYKNN